MPWIKFTADYSHGIKPRVVIAYKAGKRYLVSQACSAAAIAAGKAVASPPAADRDPEQDTGDGRG